MCVNSFCLLRRHSKEITTKVNVFCCCCLVKIRFRSDFIHMNKPKLGKGQCSMNSKHKPRMCVCAHENATNKYTIHYNGYEPYIRALCPEMSASNE